VTVHLVTHLPLLVPPSAE